MPKPKVAVFAFTSCEGCSLTILNLEDIMLEVLGAIEFVNFREAIDEKRDDYDIAFIDGAITRQAEVDELKSIRDRAKIVIPIGACAVQGGVYALRNGLDPAYPPKYVYGDKAEHFESLSVSPVEHYIDVDGRVYGCPIDKREFVEVLRSALVGKKPFVPDYPVCNECRTNENVCMFEKGLSCMGPVTRAGCGAICPEHSAGCSGCRGFVSEPNTASHREIMVRHGFSESETDAAYSLFNRYSMGR
jgi:coenzyme F420-reducing hydrogenase gamma subunit